MLRLATFNVENLFSRPAIMNLHDWESGRAGLDDVARLNTLLAARSYTDANKQEIAEILENHGFGRGVGVTPKRFVVQQVRGKLFTEVPGSWIRVTASGRGDWVGWVELVRDDLPGDQITNTGRVFEATNADLVCVVEVEDRIALDRFNRLVLGETFGVSYRFDLLVDGNDARGIDIGLLSRRPITSLCSHIHDSSDGGRIFSRDCAEYEVELEDGARLWVLGNHFKSKGWGTQAANDARRRRQADQVRSIYERRREQFEFVAVLGDLNDTPESDPLAPLLRQTDLQDIERHSSYDGQGRRGTYDTGRDEHKIDYVLLSPALFERVTASGIERRGIYAPRTFEHFPEVTSDRNSASDHALLWADLDV